jgi:uncharacterized protein (TIGR02001 family)
LNKKLLAIAVAGALATPLSFAAEEAAPAPASPLSFNVGVTTNYLFRGVSQTHGQPALSAGIDYAHDSGFYVGAWGSSISWVKDWLGKGSTEVDLYAGYKNTFAGGDWNYDLGVITYNYPGKGNASPTNLANPNTTEVYGAIGYKWVTLKYSHATSSHFIGWYGGPALNQNTKGSNYLELNAAYDLGEGWGLTGHVGSQKVKNSVTTAAAYNANYADWKVGVTKDAGFGVFSLEYSNTNAKGSCNSGGTAAPAAGASSYCWGVGGTPTTAPNREFKDVASGAVVLSLKTTF